MPTSQLQVKLPLVQNEFLVDLSNIIEMHDFTDLLVVVRLVQRMHQFGRDAFNGPVDRDSKQKRHWVSSQISKWARTL